MHFITLSHIPDWGHILGYRLYTELIPKMGSNVILAELIPSAGDNINNIKGFKFMVKNINMAVVEPTEEMLSSGLIKNIYPVSTMDTKIKNARERLNTDMLFDMGITGKGVGIAILDTGLSPTADFNGRIAAFADFTDNRAFPYDDNGHGTHVAGIACGSGALSGGFYRGIAPGAHIIPVKILDKYSRGNSLTAIMAIQWIMDNKDKYNIRLINMSAGTTDKTANIPLIRAAENAVNRGIAVIAADANENFRSTVTSPGISPKVIAVGAAEDYPSRRTYSYGALMRRTYCRKPDIYAPGTDIISCLSPEYRFEDRKGSEERITDGQYIKMCGSSMATPMISGIAALILERYPNITPKELKELICRNIIGKAGVPMPDVKSIFKL